MDRAEDNVLSGGCSIATAPDAGRLGIDTVCASIAALEAYSSFGSDSVLVALQCEHALGEACSLGSEREFGEWVAGFLVHLAN